MIRHLFKLVWNRKRANALIVAEICVSFLVVFAVLTAAVTIALAWERPLGFEWENVWDVSMSIDPTSRVSDETRAAVMRMVDEARAFPEVTAAAVSNTPPYSFSTSSGSRTHEGRQVTVVYDDVTDSFADVMKVKMLRGRWFDATDDAAKYQPAVIDANTARELFGDADPIGQKYGTEEDDIFVRIVGVSAPYRKDGETSSPINMMFLRIAPNGSYGRLGTHIVVRLRPGTSAAFEERLARRLQQVAPAISFRIRHMDQMRDNALRMRMFPLIAAGIVGLFLIAMVGLGLTGVLWQNVTRRTREIGLRRAMGASGPVVRRQILAEVVLLATIAVIIGAVVVLQLPVLGVLSLVTPAAFATGFAGALAAIYALTVLCGLYPGWLASRLTPADALRYE